jgi:mRNA interferase RelE/StbE
MNITFRKSFARDLKKMKDQAILDRVREVIVKVEEAAGPGTIADLKKLSGAENSYRIRIGEYRIGVTIEGDTVEFVRFLSRRDMYKFFP